MRDAQLTARSLTMVRDGFSLIEMAISLLVLASIAAIAIAAYGAVQDRSADRAVTVAVSTARLELHRLSDDELPDDPAELIAAIPGIDVVEGVPSGRNQVAAHRHEDTVWLAGSGGSGCLLVVDDLETDGWVYDPDGGSDCDPSQLAATYSQPGADLPAELSSDPFDPTQLELP